MKEIVVDYESYYKKRTSKDAGCSVVDLGIPNYVAATDAYMLSVVCDDYEPWCGTVQQAREQFPDGFWTDPNHQFIAANANFDNAWHRKYFPPTAHPWECVLDRGVALQLPRNLAGLAEQFLGDKVDKTLRDKMDGVHFEDLSDAEQAQIQRYCLNDSIQELKLWRTLPPMSPVEQKVAQLTRLQNRRGVHIDTDKVEFDRTRLAELKHKAFLQIPWHNDEAPLSPDALAEWCLANHLPCPVSIDKTDEKCDALMQSNPQLADVIGAMRRFRFANTLFQKANALEDRIVGNVLPLDLLYCGAPHTRRWSSKGFNVQNLPKEPTVISGPWTAEQISSAIAHDQPIPDDVHFVWLRNWLVPPPGHTFLIFDYSQIEPRVLNWLAGNEAMMAALRTGYSYYEAYARAAKGWAGAPGTLKKEFGTARYTRLKNECLGCGYGMGAKRYTSYASVPMSEAEAIVKDFRGTNPRIVEMWGKLDNYIVTAARDKSHILEVEMPSGDKLVHWDVKAHGDHYQSITTKGDYSQQSIQYRLWGGTLTENVTQRCARDILADAMVRLEEAGIPVIFSAHDEVILAVPDDPSREDAKHLARKILTTPPEWCADLPLGVEGGFARCYIK